MRAVAPNGAVVEAEPESAGRGGRSALRDLAAKDEPFFLQYWPMIPLSNPRTTVDQYTTPNGGTYVESMKQLDGYFGELMA